MNIDKWPGGGTLTLPADEAHAFTIHELAKPRLAEVEDAIARNGASFTAGTAEWIGSLGTRLRALVAAEDRPLSAADLVFAAAARCKCGAGFCYPNFTHDPHGHWFCSAILLGTAPAGSEHDAAKPFAFWSIKGEGQPSANGETTRP